MNDTATPTAEPVDRVALVLTSLAQHLPTLPQRQRVAAALAVTGPQRSRVLRAALERVRSEVPTLPLKQSASSALAYAA